MMSERFTDEAKNILALALREALQLGHNTINTEHILLAIVRDGDTLAAKALANSSGGDLSTVRRQVIKLLTANVAAKYER